MRNSSSIISGIYTITNLINNKIYIGESKNVLDRLSGHKTLLKQNKHENIYLQRAWNKYGIENFKFELLEECNEEFRKSTENYWCNLLNTHNSKYGYNLRKTTPNGYSKHSEETKKKIGIANKGKEHSKEFKEAVSKRMLGTNMPEEVKRKISEKMKGRITSPEARLKLKVPKSKKRTQYQIEKAREGLKKYYLTNPKGKKVYDRLNNKYYNSMSECLELLKINYSVFKRNMSNKGRQLNKFKLEYV
jgi:group I intron endonuclease